METAQKCSGRRWLKRRMDFEVVDGKAILTVTRSECGLLLNALNEALEAVEEWEFGTRLGWEKPRARAFLRELSRHYRSL